MKVRFYISYGYDYDCNLVVGGLQIKITLRMNKNETR